jgi:hypothetical protein
VEATIRVVPADSEITSLMKTETLKLVYRAYFHCAMSYVKILCGIR